MACKMCECVRQKLSHTMDSQDYLSLIFMLHFCDLRYQLCIGSMYINTFMDCVAKYVLMCKYGTKNKLSLTMQIAR